MRTILLWLMLVIGCAFVWAQPADIGLDIPHAVVLLIGTNDLAENAQPKSIAENPQEFLDLLHPNMAGYTKWASVLRPALAERKL